MTGPRIVGAILVREGELLLGLRGPHKKSAPGMWDAVGGHVEEGESDEQAMIREVEEETGVTPTGHVLIATTCWEGVEHYAIFKVDAWSGGEPRLNDNEHSELAWFTPAQAVALPNLAAEEYRQLFLKL